MRAVLGILLLLGAAAAAVIWAGVVGVGPFVINKVGEYRLIVRLGDPTKILEEPGPSLRIPLVDDVQVFDARLQYLNARPVEMLIEGGDKLVVDFYVVWRIVDPLEFRRSFPPPQHMRNAEGRIQKSVNGLVGATVGGLELRQLLQRAEVLDRLAGKSTEQLEGKGVEVVDIRLNRTEIPPNALPAAYQQMREQRRAISREYRVAGEREARTIRAGANREARTTVAGARSESEILRGEGDAEATRIYAEAYGKDPDFYAFVRSLEAYRRSIGDKTTLVLPPDHDFFRFLGAGTGPEGPGAASSGGR